MFSNIIRQNAQRAKENAAPYALYGQNFVTLFLNCITAGPLPGATFVSSKETSSGIQ